MNEEKSKRGLNRRRSRQSDLPLDEVDPDSVDNLYSIESEQGVLGCIIWDPVGCLPACMERIRPETFYDLRNQTIYENLVDMMGKKIPIDFVTMAKFFKSRNQLESCGGLAYLTSLQDSVPSPANLSYYLDAVIEKQLQRKAIVTMRDGIAELQKATTLGEVEDVLDDVESQVLNVRNCNVKTTSHRIGDLILGSVESIERSQSRSDMVDGLKTGFRDLDKLTLGMHGGEYWVVAARPSVGKTALAMNIAEHVAESGTPVQVFSLEMTKEQLTTRLLLSAAEVNLRNLKEGFMSNAEIGRITKAADRIKDLPLFIDDTSGLTINQLRAKSRRSWHNNGLGLIIIDYLQLLSPDRFRDQSNRNNEIAEISLGIKDLAKDLNIPILVLSQLNRDGDTKSKGVIPSTAHLRESGSIEQDADVIGLMYRPGDLRKEGDDGEGRHGEVDVNLLIAKQRNGPADVAVQLNFFCDYTRFKPKQKIADEDVPGGKRSVQGDWYEG